jgi:beta-1,4-mannosyltransferase
MQTPTWLVIVLAVVALVSFSVTIFLLPGEAYYDDTSLPSGERVRRRSRTQVLVLGDIGRSPRMQNHALSLARCGVAVDLIGYKGRIRTTR